MVHRSQVINIKAKYERRATDPYPIPNCWPQYLIVPLVRPYEPRFSSAPLIHLCLCCQRVFHVGINSVRTRHSFGEIIFAPRDLRARVSSLSSVRAAVSYTFPVAPGISTPRAAATSSKTCERKMLAVPVKTKTRPRRAAI